MKDLTKDQALAVEAHLTRTGRRGQPPRHDAPEIVRKYALGVPTTVIAKEHGINPSSVSRYIRLVGIKPDRSKSIRSGPRPLASEKVASIRRMREAGATIVAIARAYGYSTNTIAKYLRGA